MRTQGARLRDVLAAIGAIQEHLRHGGLDDGIVFDAVRMRFVEIGEAVKALDPALLAAEPDVPWHDVAGTRDWVAHHYFDTARGILGSTIENDLPRLAAAARRLLERVEG